MCCFTFHTFWDRYYFEAFQSFRKIWYSVLLETYILTYAFQNEKDASSILFFVMIHNEIKYNYQI